MGAPPPIEALAILVDQLWNLLAGVSVDLLITAVFAKQSTFVAYDPDERIAVPSFCQMSAYIDSSRLI